MSHPISQPKAAQPMETQFTEDPPHLTLRIAPNSIDTFSSLLQAGVQIRADRALSIGAFLEGLPGFTAEYITDQVQTIFLNGSATDDMETVLGGNTPVLAVSAAMPGLAGAIFRKNSLHAALRTTKAAGQDSSSAGRVMVTLKLFNAIARDRGGELLRQGVTIKAAALAQFMDKRSILAPLIQDIDVQGRTIARDELPAVLSTLDTVQLTIAD